LKGPDPKYAWLRQVSLLTGIPLLLMSGPICGYFIGNFIDQKMGTDPGFMALFTIMGGIAGVREMLKLLQRSSKNGQ
jgi:F0F1-type ATP synthase assembly protein I